MNNDLFNFTPYHKGPTSLPPISWRGYKLTGFEKKDLVSFEVHNESLAAVLKDLYPDLSLVELIRLKQCINKLDHLIDAQCVWIEILSKYNIRWTDQVDQTLKQLNDSPISFQKWVREKKVSFYDLTIFRSMNLISEFSSILNFLSEQQFSKSEGLQCLELATELKLIGLDDCAILNFNCKSWLDHLKSLRFPQTTQNDQKSQDLIKKLPWPKRTKVKWLRDGDQSKIEILLELRSKKDFKELLDGLKKVYDSMDPEWI